MTAKPRRRLQTPKSDLWSLDGLPERKNIVAEKHVRQLRAQIARAESALRKNPDLRSFGSLNYVRHLLWLLGDERTNFYANEILRQDFEGYIADLLSGWCRGRNAFLAIAQLAASRERSKYPDTTAACNLAIGDEYAKLGRAKDAGRYFRLVATVRTVPSLYRTLARTRLEALRALVRK